LAMLAYIAALLFIIAFILRVTSTGTGVVFTPESLLHLTWHSSPACGRRGRVAPSPAALTRALDGW